MPCGWEGNRKSGHVSDISGSPHTDSSLEEGDDPTLSCGAWLTLAYFKSFVV